MAFEGLSGKLNQVFKKLKSHGKLTESDVKEAMREVRMALLEADVSYKVVKDFVFKSINQRVFWNLNIDTIKGFSNYRIKYSTICHSLQCFNFIVKCKEQIIRRIILFHF